ncbi:MAG TPA: UdgX family uracil-DNA binding protein [Candidatus Binatia bacterium]|nr:UdgX family uracil-DNA binding protein [Candidatus Binatia bacterium]HET9883423.1 UdgX family uracil-DNA binding protein [Candidatus Binatia bacterium]
MVTEKAGNVSASDFLPRNRSLESLRQAAKSCKGCDLYLNATQTVFGDGPGHASVMLVGEQPGDIEDQKGEPFVGPAGRILDRALEDARISRDEVYVTNAVKHFKWIWRGKRRLHQKPSVRQVVACRPWLAVEIEVVQPDILVCLGATAAQSVIGKSVAIMKERGKFIDSVLGKLTFVTIHPSAILRQRDNDEREQEYHRFASELKLVKGKLQSLSAA